MATVAVLILSWSQKWVPYEQIAVSLKQAVILSEDENFVRHNGVEWRAIEKQTALLQQGIAALLSAGRRKR